MNYDGEIYAIISDDAQAICGLHVAGGWMPLVFLDRAKLPSMKILAQHVANVTRTSVSIYKFMTPHLLQTIHPQ